MTPRRMHAKVTIKKYQSSEATVVNFLVGLLIDSLTLPQEGFDATESLRTCHILWIISLSVLESQGRFLVEQEIF
eukprot:1320152-Amorphochlora_amoeboformis.AAC.2